MDDSCRQSLRAAAAAAAAARAAGTSSCMRPRTPLRLCLALALLMLNCTVLGAEVSLCFSPGEALLLACLSCYFPCQRRGRNQAQVDAHRSTAWQAAACLIGKQHVSRVSRTDPPPPGRHH